MKGGHQAGNQEAIKRPSRGHQEAIKRQSRGHQEHLAPRRDERPSRLRRAQHQYRRVEASPFHITAAAEGVLAHLMRGAIRRTQRRTESISV